MQKVFIASDHADINFKSEIINYLSSDYEVINLGTDTVDSVDYPDFAQKLCREVLNNPGSKGILFCGTGIGMSIAANRFKGIRAALCHSEEYAKLSREHNDANVLCLGARFLEIELAKIIIKVWLHTDFAGDRHQRRLEKIEDFTN